MAKLQPNDYAGEKLIMPHPSLLYTVVSASFLMATTSRADEKNAFNCMERLAVPRYPLIARQASLEGTVELEVHLDVEARKVRKSIRSKANPILKEAVDDAAARASFLDHCSGQEIRLLFVFQLELQADPKLYDPGDVVLQSPNRITIKAARFPLNASSPVRRHYVPRTQSHTTVATGPTTGTRSPPIQ